MDKGTFSFPWAGGGRLTHDWYVELERDVLQELEAIHVRHVHVGEHDVEVVLALAQGLQRLGTAREGGDCVVESREGSRSASGSIEGCRDERWEGAASAGRFGNRARYFYNTRMHRLARSRQRYGRS